MNRWMSSHQMPPKIREKKPRKTEAQINLLEHLELLLAAHWPDRTTKNYYYYYWSLKRAPFALFFVQQRTPIIECFANLRLCESEI